MSTSYIPVKPDIIKYVPGVTLNKDDTSANGFVRDKDYHHYVCAHSFRVNVWAQYFFFGSEHLKIQLYRYSLSQRKWILVREHADLFGGWDAISNGEWGKISVNCSTQTTDGSFNWNELSDDSIHWDIVVRRFNGVKGDHSSRVHLVLGNYTSVPEATYNNIYKGSFMTQLPNTQYKWHVQGAQVENPLNEPWGNITSKRGSIIMASNGSKIIPDSFITKTRGRN